MKKIVMILASGEEIFCGFATSIYKYLLITYKNKYVPLNGDRKYVFIRNLYLQDTNQIVSFKAE